MKPSIAHLMRVLSENIEGLELDKITPETNIKEAEGWNSMNALVVMALLETEFNVSVKVEQLRNCNSIQELYQLI